MTIRKLTRIRLLNVTAGAIAAVVLPLIVDLFVTPAFAVVPLHVDDNYGNMPLIFEANQGQFTRDIRFMARGNGYNLYLATSNVAMVLYQPLIRSDKEPMQDVSIHRLRMNFLGANPAVRLVGDGILPGSSNYIRGNNPDNWVSGIRHYKNARYQNIYPDIDLVFYGDQNRIEYDFVIKPGAHYKKIKLDYRGMEGININEDGALILRTAIGDLVQHAPYAYQFIDGQKIRVQANYVLQGKTGVGFRVAAYDHSYPLIIDPVLSYSTYLGGSSVDTVADIASDDSGNTYVTGYTVSSDFSTVAAINSATAGGVDIFISKISADGSSLVYSTYLGGSDDDWANAIAVDSSGAVAITGKTISADFPVVAAIQSAYGGSGDGFVTKLNAAGSAVAYSTFVGGTSSDEAQDIVFNANDELYVTGFTASADFPVTSGFQMTKSSANDAFVSKINVAGSAFIYSSFLGGSNAGGDDYGYAIAVDGNDNAYVAGKTTATNFPTVSAFQSLYGGGSSDAFFAKIHPLGSSVLFSSYLGGSGSEVANGVGVDGNENVYIAGSTVSPNFPVVFSSYDPGCGSDGNCDGNNYDAFVVKVQADGSALSYGTYLGGSGQDFAADIAVSDSGSVYITGQTNSTDFPTNSAIQVLYGGVIDAYILRLNSAGTALEYSTFLGGSAGDYALGIDLDGTGNVYVTGNTASSDFPVASPMQASQIGSTDVFVAKIRAITDLSVTLSDSMDPVDESSDFSYTVIVTNAGPDTAHNTTLTDILPTGLGFVSSASTQGSCSGTSTITCNLGDLAGGTSAIITLDVEASQTLTNTVNVTSSESDSDTSNNIDSEQTTVTPASNSTVVGIGNPGGGGGNDYGLFIMLMIYVTWGLMANKRTIIKSRGLRRPF